MEVTTVGVVGVGQMGTGIAHSAALGGYRVILRDVNEEILQKSLETIKKNIAKGVQLGKTKPEEMDSALAGIETTTELAVVAEKADFVIEAVPEVMKIKWEVFETMDKLCRPEVILATNTSSMSITEIASITKRPDRCIGMHFFIPAHIMRLVEVVRGLETSEETTVTTETVAHNMKKETVRINEAPGFATSRINALVGNEAFNMLMEGVGTAEDIDKAIKLGLNWPMGPFEMVDMVGLDTRLEIVKYLHETLGDRFRPSLLHVKYVKAGRLGRKVGKGVHDYTNK